MQKPVWYVKGGRGVVDNPLTLKFTNNSQKRICMYNNFFLWVTLGNLGFFTFLKHHTFVSWDEEVYSAHFYYHVWVSASDVCKKLTLSELNNFEIFPCG